jgi:hypothetical protein
VITVEKGWHGIREVNRVEYDPEKVTQKQIEQWLRKSGTYIRTVSASATNSKPEPVRE